MIRIRTIRFVEITGRSLPSQEENLFATAREHVVWIRKLPSGRGAVIRLVDGTAIETIDDEYSDVVRAFDSPVHPFLGEQ